jgi:hypothetical protein
MEFKIEVKEGNKTTVYTADTMQTKQAVKSAVEKVGDFLKGTFKKEVFTKEQ